MRDVYNRPITDENYLRYLFVAIGSTIALYAGNYFIRKEIEPLLSSFISAVIAVFVYYILDFIFFELPYKHPFFRSIIEPAARFEGHWIQTIDKDEKRFYSYIIIEYNILTKTYTILGTALDETGKIHSLWESTKLNIDIEKQRILYFYEAEMCDESREIIYGFGSKTFQYKDKRGKYTNGQGYFVDSGTKLLKCYYTFDRLTTKLIMELIDKKNVFTSDEKKELVRKYHENSEILGLFHNIGKLKKLKRAGWIRQGIPNPESVADHSFRTAFIAMILGDILELDTLKLVKMALIHEMGEVLIGDITPHDNITDKEKQRREEKAVRELLTGLPEGYVYRDLWIEFENQKLPNQ